jgi:UDP-N-acetylmuramate--alanine ligase
MYKKHEHIHFMGIGGIGMSGIARILKLQGYTVSGCDECTTSKTVQELQKIDCIIHEGHDVTHVHDADVLVYSSAVKPDNLEVVAAMHKGIPVIPRAIMLAELMRTKYSIAVSGAHGKTTTTSLIAHILIEADKQPTVVVGGVLKNIDTQACLGESNILIAEADESDRSLLYLNPTMAVVTNIDAEHLDTYKDLDDIKRTFKDFLARLPFYGKAFLCNDDEHVRAILPLHHVNVVKYGLTDDADIIGNITDLGKSQSTFQVYRNSFVPERGVKEKQLLGSITLNVPGIHNVQNALAALGVCLEFEVPFASIAHALENFKGVERRFEFKGTYKGAEIFDDYGHHPTEMHCTLKVAEKRKAKRLIVIFQPHRFSRTMHLWNDFVQLFVKEDAPYQAATIYITDIYPASEKPIENITSLRLVEQIKELRPGLDIRYIQQHNEIAELVKNQLQEGDLLLTLGAGKAYQIGDLLVALGKNGN